MNYRLSRSRASALWLTFVFAASLLNAYGPAVVSTGHQPELRSVEDQNTFEGIASDVPNAPHQRADIVHTIAPDGPEPTSSFHTVHILHIRRDVFLQYHSSLVLTETLTTLL
jgi:hypothetical protein